jgi:hypothetical protein
MINKKNKEWYRGNFKNDEKSGFGELRTKYEWKYGNFYKNILKEGVTQYYTIDNIIKFNTTIFNFKEISKRSCVPSTVFLDQSEPIHDFSLKIMPKKCLYNGYYFLSRTEIKWAIFFEYLKIDYLYEPRTFKFFNNTSYTPDFYCINICIFKKKKKKNGKKKI